MNTTYTFCTDGILHCLKLASSLLIRSALLNDTEKVCIKIYSYKYSNKLIIYKKVLEYSYYIDKNNMFGLYTSFVSHA